MLTSILTAAGFVFAGGAWVAPGLQVVVAGDEVFATQFIVGRGARVAITRTCRADEIGEIVEWIGGAT